MSYEFIKAQTQGIAGENIWIRIDHIVSVTARRENGLATVFTADGKTLFLNQKAEDVVRQIWCRDE